jgi:hypothetical protein
MFLWLFLGVMIGLGFSWIVFKSEVQLKWYEWVLAFLGIVLVLFAAQNIQASSIELEPSAGTKLFLVVGLPGLILVSLAYLLPMMRTRNQAE